MKNADKIGKTCYVLGSGEIVRGVITACKEVIEANLGDPNHGPHLPLKVSYRVRPRSGPYIYLAEEDVYFDKEDIIKDL